MTRLLKEEKQKLIRIIQADFSLDNFLWEVVSRDEALSIEKRELGFDVTGMRVWFGLIRFEDGTKRCDCYLNCIYETQEEAIAYLERLGLGLLKSNGMSDWNKVSEAFKRYGITMPKAYQQIFGGQGND